MGNSKLLNFSFSITSFSDLYQIINCIESVSQINSINDLDELGCTFSRNVENLIISNLNNFDDIFVIQNILSNTIIFSTKKYNNRILKEIKKQMFQKSIFKDNLVNYLLDFNKMYKRENIIKLLNKVFNNHFNLSDLDFAFYLFEEIKEKEKFENNILFLFYKYNFNIFKFLKDLIYILSNVTNSINPVVLDILIKNVEYIINIFDNNFCHFDHIVEEHVARYEIQQLTITTDLFKKELLQNKNLDTEKIVNLISILKCETIKNKKYKKILINNYL